MEGSDVIEMARLMCPAGRSEAKLRDSAEIQWEKGAIFALKPEKSLAICCLD